MAEIDVKMEDHSQEMQAALKQAIAKALEEIGIAAHGYATKLCRVDTGRLRNSITWATSARYNGYNQFGGDPKSGGQKADGTEYTPYGKAEENEVWLGTNVEYARHVEQSVKAFIKPAIENHIGKYRQIIQQELGSLSGGD